MAGRPAIRRQRGFSIMEGLVASVILGLTLTGMFGLWAGLFSRFTRTREVAQATQMARAELERAKVFGVDNLPTGTYDSSSNTGTWSGSYDPTSNAWVSGGATYYDFNGNQVTNALSSGAKFMVQDTIVDSNVLPKAGGYTFRLQSKKSLAVTVKQLPNKTTLFTVGTNLVSGGL